MGLGPSRPPPRTSLRCGYSNSNNSRAGPEDSSPWFARGGLLLPHSQSLGGLESSAGRGHPQGQACRRKPSPAQGGPPCPGAPQRCSDGCAHTGVPAGPGHTCASKLPAVHCPLGSITWVELTFTQHAYSGGARAVCGPTRGSAVTDAHFPRRSCLAPPPTQPSPLCHWGSQPFLPSLLLPVCPFVCSQLCLSVCLSPSGCLSLPLLSQS